MTATKITAHSNCDHASTKSARALCRKNRSTVETVITKEGKFEIKVIKVQDLKKTDEVLFRPGSNLLPFFSHPTADAFQVQRYNRKTEQTEPDGTYNVSFGSRNFVPEDTEYTVAVDPKAVVAARDAARRALSESIRNIGKTG